MSEVFSVEEKVKRIFSRKTGIVTVELSDRLIEELGLDSLDVVEIVMDLERSFNVVIDEIDIDNIKTVDDVVQSLKKKITN